MKKLVKFVRNYTPYMAGEIVAITDPVQYVKLKKWQVVEDHASVTPVVEHSKLSTFREELSGRNLYGTPYKKGVVDVVIPTTNERKPAPLPAYKKIGMVNIIVRQFSREVGGFAKSCNDGARMNESLGEFILFLNDDAKLHAGFFEQILAPFKDPEVGIVGTQASLTSWGVNGSIMVIRRELFERMGGFDTTFFFMWEDNDVCTNIRRMGYKIEIANTEAIHEGNRSVKDGSIFWETNFTEGKNYYHKKWDRDAKRLIGLMVCGNEEGRYLEMTVEDIFKRGLIDELVIVLDAPTDGTASICHQLGRRYPITIHRHAKRLFGHAENLLRERAVHYALSKNPYGILPIDADEIFDEDVTREKLIGWLDKGIAWDFYVCHFWKNREHIRLDGVFGHQTNIRLFRAMRDRAQTFYDKPVHCGSAPVYAYENRHASDHLFKHYGYASEADVKAKIERYGTLDPKGEHESLNFYQQFKTPATVIEYNKKAFINNWNR